MNVAPTTTYFQKDVTAPSFANVCVGTNVRAKGTVAEQVITATKVVVKPPRAPHVRKAASGPSLSVNGVSTAGTCGAAATAGSFTLTGHKGTIFTVNVDPATAFKVKDVETPSFANVCVGAFVLAKGTFVDTTVAATNVYIAPVREKHDRKHKHHKRSRGAVRVSRSGQRCEHCRHVWDCRCNRFVHADRPQGPDADRQRRRRDEVLRPGRYRTVVRERVCRFQGGGLGGEDRHHDRGATKAFVLAEHIGDGHKRWDLKRGDHKRGDHKHRVHKGRRHKHDS